MVSGLNGQTAHSNGSPSPGYPATGPYAHLRAVILLTGSVRQSEFSRAVNRSLLDLPVDNSGRSVLSLWQDNAEDLAGGVGLEHLPLRIVLSHTASAPAIPVPRARVRLTIERDAKEFRGTGGVLRDLADSYAPDDLILVANAAQILTEPLADLTAELLADPAEVSFIGHGDGTPCGLFLVRCAVLSSIRDIGFLDFKEQVLPKLGAAGHRVRAVMHSTATGLPVRTLGSYLSGLKSFTRLRSGSPRDTDPFSEDWQPTFAIREKDSVIDDTATIHDSVVMTGAKIGRGAVIVRSVVGPGAIVEDGETIADRAVGAPEDAITRGGGLT